MSKTILFLLSVAMLLTGCADFHDVPGKSVWSEGLWLIPTLTGAGSVACFVICFFFQNKGSKEWNDRLGRYDYIKEAVPFYKRWAFIWGSGLLLATIAIIWYVVAER